MNAVDGLRRPARILHVINDLSVGGAEVMLINVLAGLDRTRFDPVVISLMDRGRLRDRIEGMGIPVHSPRMTPRLPSLASWLRFFRLVRLAAPDLTMAWLHHANVAAQLARVLRQTRGPVVWSIHGTVYALAHEKPMTARAIRLGAHLSRLAAAIVYVSRTSQGQHSRLGYDPDRSVVFPNGVDTEEFLPSAEARRAVRAEIGVPDSALLVGHIGRYHPMKDHPNLLHAFAALRRQHANARLLLAGRGVTPDNHALTSLASGLGLDGSVHLVGERDDVNRLAASLDVLVLSSSRGEGFPVAVVEAMSCEVPCIVTNVGDAAWIVGETGLVVAPADPAAMTGALLSVADLGPSGRWALGQAARRRVLAHFSVEAVVDRYEQLFVRLLNPPPTPPGTGRAPAGS